MGLASFLSAHEKARQKATREMNQFPRGTELLDLCRSKIRKAEVEVTQIVQRLEEPEEAVAQTVDPYGEDDEIPF
jgi:hypothetical protein